MKDDGTAKQGTILLVDDEDNVLRALERSLHRAGDYAILKCSGAREALTLLKTERVDVVISDHLMPEMKGMDFLVEVRKRHPDVIRILLTGHADVEVAIAGINSGKLFRFLQKPWDDDELRRIVAKALEVSKLQHGSRAFVEDVKNQEEYKSRLESKYPGISKVKRDKDGTIIIDE
ncbi:MAG TPA: response regulator [bacterium]|nr:response regulator [bacterium]